ncbi:hypothetical protein [Picosynechococcus sp. NKBG15041c]|uniref:hypothetical protein n=1 Tax=Picosynechococcus sp. NKBG15041c TaxID=1407650 RepID=UPI00130D9E01|nr:hypothetical protein [Picosynechococcus sp. NKBG15041c]
MNSNRDQGKSGLLDGTLKIALISAGDNRMVGSTSDQTPAKAIAYFFELALAHFYGYF